MYTSLDPKAIEEDPCSRSIDSACSWQESLTGPSPPEIEANPEHASQSSAGLSKPFTIVVPTSGRAESTRQMLRSGTLMWICVVYLASVGVFLTIAERAPIDPGRRYSDDH